MNFSHENDTRNRIKNKNCMKYLSLIFLTSLFPLLVFGQQWNDIAASTKVNDIVETTSTIWMATNGGLVSVDKQTNTVSQFTKAKDLILLIIITWQIIILLLNIGLV